MSTTPSPNSLWFGSYSSLKSLYQTLIASLDSERSSPSGTSRAPPVRQMAPVRRRWPRSSGRRRWHGRHGAPHSLSARPFSSFLSLALALAETPSPLPPRASPAPRALASASCFASERLQVRLELLHLLHPSVGRDLPEVSGISQVLRRRVRGRRDTDSGEPRRCSTLASFLLSG